MIEIRITDEKGNFDPQEDAIYISYKNFSMISIAAHEMNMTLNDFFNYVVKEKLKELKDKLNGKNNSHRPRKSVRRNTK